MSKLCPLCDHSFDYHRVKPTTEDENILYIKCVGTKFIYDKEIKAYKAIGKCECNGGFKNTVKIEYTLHEQYVDWRFGNVS